MLLVLMANTRAMGMEYKLMDSQHAIDDVNNLPDGFSQPRDGKCPVLEDVGVFG